MKIKISESRLRSMIEESVRKTLINSRQYDDTINEDWKSATKAAKTGLLGLGLAATMASCGGDNTFNQNEPVQTEITNADKQYTKFDWSLITDEANQGFIYDMYSGCAGNGSRAIACIIQKDKYCWRYYVPDELKNEIFRKYNNKEVVDISELEPFSGWRGY